MTFIEHSLYTRHHTNLVHKQKYKNGSLLIPREQAEEKGKKGKRIGQWRNNFTYKHPSPKIVP